MDVLLMCRQEYGARISASEHLFFFLKTTLVAFMLIYIFPAAPTSFGSYFELFYSVANSVA